MEDPNWELKEDYKNLRQEMFAKDEQHFQAIQKLKAEFCAELRYLQGFVQSECTFMQGRAVIPVGTLDVNLVNLMEKFTPVMPMRPAIDKAFTDAINEEPKIQILSKRDWANGQ